MSDTSHTSRPHGAEVPHPRTRRRTASDRLSGLDRAPTVNAPAELADDEPAVANSPTTEHVPVVDDGWPVVALPAWLDPPETTGRRSGHAQSGATRPDGMDGPDQLDHRDDPEHREPGNFSESGNFSEPGNFSESGNLSQSGKFSEPDYLDDTAEPDEPRRRFAMAPPAAIAIILIGVVACVIAGYGLFRGADEPPAVNFPAVGPAASTPPITSGQPAGVPTTSAGTSGTRNTAEVVVSVVGLVHKPGLVRLGANSRVADALAAAGGAREGADTVSLNLAQVVRDGDQILVGYAGQQGRLALRSALVPASGASGTGSNPAAESGAAIPAAPPAAGSSGAGGLINLNTASAAELDALPGVGPVTARAIIEWRTRNGKFASVDQLGEVDGIGPARLAKLRTLVTV